MSIFAPNDHLRHPADADGRMRDSLFWQTIFGPERLGFQAYLYLTAKGKAGFNVILWGEGKPILFERIEGEVPSGMDLDDFRLEGLHLANTGVGAPARLSFEGKRGRFAFTFEGNHEPFSYRDNPDGLPVWFAQNRLEQSGRIAGFIEAGGTRLDFDQPGHRDQSWGNRNWGMPQHWKWFCAYTADGAVALNGWIWIARGEMGAAGYVWRDGVVRPIASVRQHGRFDPDMSQRGLDAELIDVDGGTTHLTFERFGLVKLPTGDQVGTIIQEAACDATIDGQPALGQYETHWHQSYIDHLVETRSTL